MSEVTNVYIFGSMNRKPGLRWLFGWNEPYYAIKRIEELSSIVSDEILIAAVKIAPQDFSENFIDFSRVLILDRVDELKDKDLEESINVLILVASISQETLNLINNCYLSDFRLDWQKQAKFISDTTLSANFRESLLFFSRDTSSFTDDLFSREVKKFYEERFLLSIREPDIQNVHNKRMILSNLIWKFASVAKQMPTPIANVLRKFSRYPLRVARIMSR